MLTMIGLVFCLLLGVVGFFALGVVLGAWGEIIWREQVERVGTIAARRSSDERLHRNL